MRVTMRMITTLTCPPLVMRALTMTMMMAPRQYSNNSPL